MTSCQAAEGEIALIRAEEEKRLKKIMESKSFDDEEVRLPMWAQDIAFSI